MIPCTCRLCGPEGGELLVLVIHGEDVAISCSGVQARYRALHGEPPPSFTARPASAEDVARMS